MKLVMALSQFVIIPVWLCRVRCPAV